MEPERKKQWIIKVKSYGKVIEKIRWKKRYDDEYVGLAKYSIQSEFADLLIRYKDWNYKETKYLGLDCYKIEGVINIEMPVSTSEDLRGKLKWLWRKYRDYVEIS